MNLELIDACPRLTCGMCEFFKVNAEMEGIESTCKRLDHKKFKFATPWFKSYDCGLHSGCVCTEFKPSENSKYLHEHWTGFEDYFGEIDPKETVGLEIDGNREVRFHVRRTDFVNGTFINSDGNLKWVKKQYYKRTRKSPTGYELITEFNPEEGET